MTSLLVRNREIRISISEEDGAIVFSHQVAAVRVDGYPVAMVALLDSGTCFSRS
jgi:hypothetical protein